MEDWFARNFWVDEVDVFLLFRAVWFIWGSQILRAMARRVAVKQAIDLETGAELSLEQGLGIVSGFWGIEASHVCDQLGSSVALIITFGWVDCCRVRASRSALSGISLGNEADAGPRGSQI